MDINRDPPPDPRWGWGGQMDTGPVWLQLAPFGRHVRILCDPFGLPLVPLGLPLTSFGLLWVPFRRLPAPFWHPTRTKGTAAETSRNVEWIGPAGFLLAIVGSRFSPLSPRSAHLDALWLPFGALQAHLEMLKQPFRLHFDTPHAQREQQRKHRETSSGLALEDSFWLWIPNWSPLLELWGPGSLPFGYFQYPFAPIRTPFAPSGNPFGSVLAPNMFERSRS